MNSSHKVGPFGWTVGLGLLLSACTPAQPQSEPAPPGDPSTLLTIEITNEQLEEARVWLWVERSRRALGTVRGTRTETFYHPIRQISTVHLEFDLTLGARCVTRDVSLGPGDEVKVTIPTNLNMMAAVCRRR